MRWTWAAGRDCLRWLLPGQELPACWHATCTSPWQRLHAGYVLPCAGLRSASWTLGPNLVAVQGAARSSAARACSAGHDSCQVDSWGLLSVVVALLLVACARSADVRKLSGSHACLGLICWLPLPVHRQCQRLNVLTASHTSLMPANYCATMGL